MTEIKRPEQPTEQSANGATAPLTLEAAPEITTIREALDAGPTRGPWHSYTLGGLSPADVPPGGHIIELPKVLQDRSVAMRPEDARYIAACNPAAMTAVLATIAQLEARLREAEADVRRWDFVRHHWSHAQMRWNNDATNSLKSIVLTIKTAHWTSAADAIESQIDAAIAAHGKDGAHG